MKEVVESLVILVMGRTGAGNVASAGSPPRPASRGALVSSQPVI
jgi:hypothetical protein